MHSVHLLARPLNAFTVSSNQYPKTPTRRLANLKLTGRTLNILTALRVVHFSPTHAESLIRVDPAGIRRLSRKMHTTRQ